MEIIVEVLLELVGQSVASVIATVFDGRRPGGAPQEVRLLGFLFLGLLAGWLSVELFPRHILSTEGLRVAWLFVSPFTAGALAWALHAVFFKRQERRWPMLHAAVLAGTVTTWRFFALA